VESTNHLSCGAARPCSSAAPARVAACKLKPASRTDSGALITTLGRPSNAISTGRRRSPGLAGARPATAAAASCEDRVALRELVRNGQHLGFRVNGDDLLTLQVPEDVSARDLKDVRDIAC
jgi:hypothetical protein